MDLYCFDMDGTVLDSMPTLELFATEVISKLLDVSREVALNSYRQTTGIPFVEQMSKICDWDPQLAARAANIYEELHEAALPLFQLAPGILEAMQEVKGEGHQTALVTSTYMYFVEKLYQVRPLLFSYTGGFYKHFPKDAQIMKCLEVMTLQYEAPEHLYLFGDTISDARCAQLVGAQFHEVTIPNVADTVRRVLRGARV
jgi:phosphoglycolate phosphatase-like HAD superfamily hydrolase